MLDLDEQKKLQSGEIPAVGEQVVEGISCGTDTRLAQYLEQTVDVLKSIIEKGYNHWVIAYSGGKDSTLVSVIIEGAWHLQNPTENAEPVCHQIVWNDQIQAKVPGT